MKTVENHTDGNEQVANVYFHFGPNIKKEMRSPAVHNRFILLQIISGVTG